MNHLWTPMLWTIFLCNPEKKNLFHSIFELNAHCHIVALKSAVSNTKHIYCTIVHVIYTSFNPVIPITAALHEPTLCFTESKECIVGSDKNSHFIVHHSLGP